MHSLSYPLLCIMLATQLPLPQLFPYVPYTFLPTPAYPRAMYAPLSVLRNMTPCSSPRNVSTCRHDPALCVLSLKVHMTPEKVLLV